MNWPDVPALIVGDCGFTTIVRPETVTVTPLEMLELAAEVAVIVTVKSDVDGMGGAVYVVAIPLAVALGETEPHGADAHVKVHVTPFALESFATVAETCAAPPASNVVGVTVTVRLIAGGGVWLIPPPHALIAIRSPLEKIAIKILAQRFMPASTRRNRKRPFEPELTTLKLRELGAAGFQLSEAHYGDKTQKETMGSSKRPRYGRRLSNQRLRLSRCI